MELAFTSNYHPGVIKEWDYSGSEKQATECLENWVPKKD
jgi:hypothetical protein